jgi:hypothetical protein
MPLLESPLLLGFLDQGELWVALLNCLTCFEFPGQKDLIIRICDGHSDLGFQDTTIKLVPMYSMLENI